MAGSHVLAHAFGLVQARAYVSELEQRLSGREPPHRQSAVVSPTRHIVAAGDEGSAHAKVWPIHPSRGTLGVL